MWEQTLLHGEHKEVMEGKEHSLHLHLVQLDKPDVQQKKDSKIRPGFPKPGKAGKRQPPKRVWSRGSHHLSTSQGRWEIDGGTLVPRESLQGPVSSVVHGTAFVWQYLL